MEPILSLGKKDIRKLFRAVSALNDLRAELEANGATMPARRRRKPSTRKSPARTRAAKNPLKGVREAQPA